MLLRVAVDDDVAQSRMAIEALRRASFVVVTNTALCEFAWVLGRGYRRSRAEIADAVHRLLDAETVMMDRAAVSLGLAFLDAGSDISDGIIAHEGRRAGGEVFLSFDARARDAARRSGIDATAP